MADPQDSIDAYARDGAHLRESVRVPRGAVIVVGVAVMAIGTCVGLAFRDASRRADRDRCAANLKQIGQAMLLYSVANGSRYPNSFATLMRSPPRYRDGTSFDFAMFVCPSSGDATPANADAADGGSYRLTADTMLTSIEIAKYGYILSGAASGEHCAAIEVPGHHGGQVAVLLSDGHVEFRAVSKKRSSTWAEVQDDVIKNRPLRWPASQPWR